MKNIYLYLKIHNQTGLMYLGRTVSKDPHKYQGSGTYWQRHIKKYGYDVTTTILYKTPYMYKIKEMGLYYSELWDVVKSVKFANLTPENGCGGNGGANKGMKHTEETKQKISKTKKNSKFKHSKESKQKIAQCSKNRTHSKESKIKIGAAHKGTKQSEESKEKYRNTIKIRYGDNNPSHSKEANQKRSKTLKGRKKTHAKVTCPHCGMTGNKPIMVRWHFNNCKHKVE